jgi:hypothetical protein
MQHPRVTIITSVAEAGTLETMPVDAGMELIRTEDLLRSDRRFDGQERVCITSEYSLAAIVNRLDPVRRDAVEVLKDKFRFRSILQDLYPGYRFRLIRPGDIAALSVDRPSVIKPRRGIFGTAVRMIGPETDFGTLSLEMNAEIEKNAKVYPESVLSPEEFLIEDFIDGEEYAVDMFYDSEGRPCIVNIAHHPFPRNMVYLHMLYNTSKEAFEAVYHDVKRFFGRLNEVLRVTRFVMHAEVRVCRGMVYPVEVNAMRLGGMGLCNLVHYALAINPFLCYLNDTEPDWDSVWEGREERIYSFFIAYNGAAIEADRHEPRYEALESRFTRIIRKQPFNHRKQLAFGVYFLEETKENIRKLLNLEFDEFFEPLQSTGQS